MSWPRMAAVRRFLPPSNHKLAQESRVREFMLIKCMRLGHPFCVDRLSLLAHWRCVIFVRPPHARLTVWNVLRRGRVARLLARRLKCVAASHCNTRASDDCGVGEVVWGEVGWRGADGKVAASGCGGATRAWFMTPGGLYPGWLRTGACIRAVWMRQLVGFDRVLGASPSPGVEVFKKFKVGIRALAVSAARFWYADR